jgi:hypothetical protein
MGLWEDAMAQARSVWRDALPYSPAAPARNPFEGSLSSWLGSYGFDMMPGMRQFASFSAPRTNREKVMDLKGEGTGPSVDLASLTPGKAMELYASQVQPSPTIPGAPAQPNLPVDAQRSQALAYARALFGEEGMRVLNATFETEGGWSGAVGDTKLNPVGSHGPLQFYGGGGQLNAFAAEKGFKDLAKAGEYVRTHPLEAVIWALNGYYGRVLRQGLDMGLRGPELATYVQANAQRSENPERAGANYMRLYGR